MPTYVFVYYSAGGILLSLEDKLIRLAKRRGGEFFGGGTEVKTMKRDLQFLFGNVNAARGFISETKRGIPKGAQTRIKMDFEVRSAS